MELGSAYNYEQLLNGVKEEALSKLGVGGDKLKQASELLSQAGLVNAELGNFGFYKHLQNAVKEFGTEALQGAMGKPKPLLGTEGTAMKDFQPISETQEVSPEVQQISKGVFGRQILEGKPVAPPTQEEAPEAPTTAPARPRTAMPEEQPAQEEFDDPLRRRAPLERPAPTNQPIEAQAEAVADRPVVPTEPEATEGLVEDLASGARANLSSDVAGMTQSIRGSFFGKISQVYDKAIDYKQSLESGIENFTKLKSQATDFAQGLRGQAQDLQNQGRAYIQQGQDLLSRGESAGQDLINQGQGLLNKSLEQGMNSELFETAMTTARSKIQQGQQLLNNGDRAGVQLLQDGQDQLAQAQSAIKGFGGQGRLMTQQLQGEIESRTQQLNDVAETLANKAGSATQAMSDIGNAVRNGDVEGAVQQTQSAVKTVGKVAGDLGVDGGEEIASGIADAIPVVGEIISAGLLIASLFTGFMPHENAVIAPTITATQAFGV
jgi:hypothetical protein